MTKTLKRLPELDIIRSLCVLYIVGVWHLDSYLAPQFAFSGYTLSVLHNVTIAVLGTFTLLSGLLLEKYRFEGWRDVVSFYKKRLGRFFLLLLLSAVTYWLAGWISPRQLLQVLTGTNLILGPSVPTLWFFSMMVLFYILTPVLRIWAGNSRLALIPAIVVLLLLIALVYGAGADVRLLYYYPCYAIGLFVGTGRFVRFIDSRWLFWLIPLVAGLFIPKAPFIVAEVSGIVLLCICCRLFLRAGLDKAFFVVSTASMIAYLFHRQFFSGVQRLFEYRGVGYIPLGWALLLLPVLFAICYLVQIVYDKILKK